MSWPVQDPRSIGGNQHFEEETPWAKNQICERSESNEDVSKGTAPSRIV